MTSEFICELVLLYCSTVSPIDLNSFPYRSASYQFSALQLHEDELAVASEGNPSSNQAIYQEDSDDVSQLAFN